MKPFFVSDNLAAALVLSTAIAAVLLEWAVTLHERVAGEPVLGRRVRLAAATLGEVTLLRTGERREEDRNTKWLMVGSAAVALAVAWAAHQRLPGLAFPATEWPPTILGLAVIWTGVGLRAWAIVTLGRFFRRDVQVAADQVVVRGGPYAAIRHPAYTGNLLVFAGFGLLLANWASLAVLIVVPLLGVAPRITVEESLLQARFGEAYRRYADETSRLIPHLW